MAITCNPSTFRSISSLFLPVWTFVLNCVWESEDSYTAFLLWSSETLCIYRWTCCNCYFAYTHTKAHTWAQTHTQRQKRRETTTACKRVKWGILRGKRGSKTKQARLISLSTKDLASVCDCVRMCSAAFVGVLPLLSMLSSLVSY